MAGILETLAEWLVSVSQWFDDWDITILVPALIILTVIAGVTGRAATGRDYGCNSSGARRPSSSA